MQSGHISRAVQELRAAVSLDDSIADGHLQLGRALIQSGETAEGKRELGRARELHDARRRIEQEQRSNTPLTKP
jgi:Flp pilus assembly protein TadD